MITENGKILKYSICENKEGNLTYYGLKLTEDIGKIHREEVINGISISKDFVYDLLSVLSENLIGTVHFRDIVEDYVQGSF